MKNKRYIRTEDGRIIDVEKFIDKEKKSEFYEEHKSFELKNEDKECILRWTAVGTKLNSIDNQVGRRCSFSASISSPFIKVANTIEELIQDGDLCRLDGCCVQPRDITACVKVFPHKDYTGISVPGVEYSTKDVLELWIKNEKGNFIKVAEKKSKKGRLKLL